MNIFQLLITIFTGLASGGIFLLFYQYLALNRARQQEVWAFLVTELNKIVKEMHLQNGGDDLPEANKKLVCRMLHDYLDGLREIIAIEPEWLILPWPHRSKRRHRLIKWYTNLVTCYDTVDCYDYLTIFHPDGDPYKNPEWRHQL